MRKKLSTKGVSLIEVIIATVIFSIAALGLFSTISMMRISADVSDKRLGAAHFGRQCLEYLRAKVDQRAVNQGTGDYTNELSLGVHSCPADPNGVYSAAYTVTQDATTGARKVDLTVNWNE